MRAAESAQQNESFAETAVVSEGVGGSNRAQSE